MIQLQLNEGKDIAVIFTHKVDDKNAKKVKFIIVVSVNSYFFPRLLVYQERSTYIDLKDSDRYGKRHFLIIG